MSAFVVSKTHIDALVSAGLSLGEKHPGQGFELRWGRDLELTRETADRVGAMLWWENVKSVNHRYRERDGAPIYRFKRVEFPLVVILKALACYEYQTCEHDAWPLSEAHQFCKALQHAMIRELPGYKEAPWGIYDPVPAVRP